MITNEIVYSVSQQKVYGLAELPPHGINTEIYNDFYGMSSDMSNSEELSRMAYFDETSKKPTGHSATGLTQVGHFSIMMNSIISFSFLKPSLLSFLFYLSIRLFVCLFVLLLTVLLTYLFFYSFTHLLINFRFHYFIISQHLIHKIFSLKRF